MKYVPPLREAENASYRNFNPVQGEAGSIVPAEAIEHPMREIVNAITAMGLDPSEHNLNQLAQIFIALESALSNKLEIVFYTEPEFEAALALDPNIANTPNKLIVICEAEQDPETGGGGSSNSLRIRNIIHMGQEYKVGVEDGTPLPTPGAMDSQAAAVDSAWLYPNGGTAQAPMAVAPNTRYVLDSPWPGYFVECWPQVQIYSNGWGNPGWDQGYGLLASHLIWRNQLIIYEEIVVQTGTKALIGPSLQTGSPWNTLGDVTSAPGRVYCKKGGPLP